MSHLHLSEALHHHVVVRLHLHHPLPHLLHVHLQLGVVAHQVLFGHQESAHLVADLIALLIHLDALGLQELIPLHRGEERRREEERRGEDERREERRGGEKRRREGRGGEGVTIQLKFKLSLLQVHK